MGMTDDKLFSISPSTEDIVTALDSAEKLFWADLAAVARHGNVTRVRSATVSLAVIRALQSSLGRAAKVGPVLMASLLGAFYASIWLQPLTNFSPRRLCCDHAAPRDA